MSTWLVLMLDACMIYKYESELENLNYDEMTKYLALFAAPEDIEKEGLENIVPKIAEQS